MHQHQQRQILLIIFLFFFFQTHFFMKAKFNFPAKLTLNKETVSKLNAEQMTKIQGGVVEPGQDRSCTGTTSGKSC